MKNKTAIVFSTSLDIRNCLRNIASKCGLSAVCFENESICFDNIDTIQPKIVIAETDSPEVVWRFGFALHANNITAPLLVVSDRLNTAQFVKKGLRAPVSVITMDHLWTRLSAKAAMIIDEKKGGGKETENKRLLSFVGNTDEIEQIRSMVPSIADTCDPVIITGEQGTGKKLLANLISGVEKGKAILQRIDCAKLKPGMIIDDGFAQMMDQRIKGASRIIFLDHLDQLPIASQSEILPIIESSMGAISGASRKSVGTTRFMAASDRNIEGLVQKGSFRKELFYRLNVMPITLPPLRERKADIPLLMDYFIIGACIEKQKCVWVPSPKAREICTIHNWPGNVEELKCQIGRTAETGNEKHLLDYVGMDNVHINNQNALNRLAVEELPKSYEIKGYLPVSKNMSLKSICDEFASRTEKRLMKIALESTSWNRKKAAKLLNISYKSMLNKLKVYDIV